MKYMGKILKKERGKKTKPTDSRTSVMKCSAVRSISVLLLALSTGDAREMESGQNCASERRPGAQVRKNAAMGHAQILKSCISS